MKKNCCWVNYKCVIIQNQTVILEIKSNCATKKKLGHATDVDTSNLAAKKISLLWKLKLTN